eukprot:TRINITY_DN4762_c0_g1_i1.p1 TRINITY_DN4762_c0_g1~~TRINITY_DN4762_c0_g1_i1.p1  ORF type:complete len:219 (+),score=29.94 TRINITY_DN4762_c0_g1_i1:376-1032(+)
MTGPNGDISVQINKNENGTFTGQYEYPLPLGLPPGDYSIHIYLNEKPIENFTHYLCSRTHTRSREFLCKGKGLSGTRGDFIVFPIEKHGDIYQNAKCNIEMEGPKGDIPVQIINNDDGTLTAKYSYPLPPGNYSINIFLDGHKLEHNASNTFVVDTVLDPGKSYTKGPGLYGSSGEFTVVSISQTGDPFRKSQCKIQMTGPTGNIPVQTRKKKKYRLA